MITPSYSNGTKFRQRCIDQWLFDYNLEYTDKVFSNEVDKALVEIANKYGSINVYFSGGIDSEYLIRKMQTLRIDFTAYFVDYEINEYDRDWAFNIARTFNFDLKTIKLSKSFFESSRIQSIWEDSQCASPVYAALMETIVDNGKFNLWGTADPEYRLLPNFSLSNSLHGWYFVDYEYDWGIYRYLQKHSIPGTANFFYYNKALVDSWASHPMNLKLINGELGGKTTSWNIKHDIYDMKFAARKKATGFDSRPDLFYHYAELGAKHLFGVINGSPLHSDVIFRKFSDLVEKSC